VADVIFDGVVETDYGQFDLLWGDGSGFDGDFERFFREQVNGLAGAASSKGLYQSGSSIGRVSGPDRAARHGASAPPRLGGRG
jgi:hypothetical protein